METNGSNGHDADEFHTVYRANPASQFAHLLETNGGRIDCTCGHPSENHINKGEEDFSCQVCDCPRWVPDI